MDAKMVGRNIPARVGAMPQGASNQVRTKSTREKQVPMGGKPAAAARGHRLSKKP